MGAIGFAPCPINAIVVLAEQRLALAVKRPESFVKVTFDNAPAAEYGAPSADYGAPAADFSMISEPAESFNLLTLVLRQEVIYNLFLT